MRKSIYRLISAVLILAFAAGCSEADSSQVSTPSESAAAGISVFGGKYQNPFADSDLMRYDDLNDSESYEKNGFNYTEDDAFFPMSDVTEADIKPEEKLAFPQMGSTDYYSDELPIYNFNVLDFGAVADGKTDCTNEIQQALTMAGTVGGGTVYIPAGRYCVKGNLRVPEMVTLRGDFSAPDDESAPSEGTVLLAYSGRNDKEGSPFVVLSMSACLQNMTIYYPEQKAGDICYYPPTVSANHMRNNYSADSQSIKNVWFVNSYYIFDMESAPYTGLHLIQNIYGTPLDTGFAVKMCKDVGRIEGVYFSPQYWIKAQERGIASKVSDEDNQKMFDYVYENSEGIKIYSSDWEYIYNYNANGLSSALQFPREDNHSSNIQITHSSFLKCRYGIDVYVMNSMGSSFSNMTVVCADDENSAAVISHRSSDNPLMFNNCDFISSEGSAVYLEGAEIAQFVNCSFSGGNGKYTIENLGASLMLLQCEFVNKEKHILCHEEAKGIQVLGCKFHGAEDIKNEKKESYKTVVDNSGLNLPVMSGISHIYSENLPLPKSKNIYYIYSYGAKINEDCTEAFKAAINDAAKSGGTIYVPGGKYYLSESIQVPKGVEIRGCKTTNLSPKDLKGTVIMATPDVNSSEPLIKLEPHSGISGLSVYYPEQKFENGKFVEYPFTIQGLGEGVYVKNVCLINSYRGIDFATYPSDNHYLNYVNGCPLKTGILLGNNKKNGWMENCHFNPHYYKDTNIKYNYDNDNDVLTEFLLSNCESFVLEDNYSEHLLHNFSYASDKGIAFKENNGKTTNALVIGQGEDNSRNAIFVSGCDKIELVNSTLCVINHDKDILYFNITENNKGSVSVYNTVFMGQYQEAANIAYVGSGNNIFQQGHLYQGSKYNGFKAENCDIDVSAYIFPSVAAHFELLPTLGTVNIKANFGLINDTSSPADDILVIKGREERFNIAQNRLK